MTPNEAPPTLAEMFAMPEVYWTLAGIVFVFGLLFGSFFNVCIYRLPLGMSVNSPRRSFCFRCGSMIHWFDNIPVLSYLALGGRCRSCGASFSARYAGVELLTAVIWLAIFLAHNHPAMGGYSLSTIWYLAFASLLIIGTFTDFDHWIIPAGITRWGTVAALVAAVCIGIFDPAGILTSGGPFPHVRLVQGDWVDATIALLDDPSRTIRADTVIHWWEPVVNALLGAVIAPVMIWSIGYIGKLLFRKEAMGFGDVELFAMIGATVGPFQSVVVLMLASMFGAAAGMANIVRNRVAPRSASPLLEGKALADGAPAAHAPALDDESRARLVAASEDLQLAFVDLAAEAPTADALEALSADRAKALGVLPLSIEGNRLRVAVVDPFNTRLIADLRSACAGREVDFVLADAAQLAAVVEAGPVAGAEGDDLWKRAFDVASLAPVPKQLHHLPFIPWIACGALLLVIAYPWLRK